MPNYRLPGGLAQITVNGRTYRADAAGLVTATGVDAAAIAGAGGLVDGGAGSAPEWSLAADGTADGLIGPDGTKATGNTAIAAAALGGDGADLIMNFPAYPSVTSDSSVKSFRLGAHSYPDVNLPYSAAPDVCWSLGYNMRGGSSRYDESTHGFGITFEHFYYNGGIATTETHIQTIQSDGSVRRAYQVAAPISGTTGGSTTFSSNQYVFQNFDGSKIPWNFTTTGTPKCSVSESAYFEYGVNNVAVGAQKNAAGNAFLTLPYMDSADTLRCDVPLRFGGSAATSGSFSGYAYVFNPALTNGQTGILLQASNTTGAINAAKLVGRTTGDFTVEVSNLLDSAAAGHAILLLQTGPTSGDPQIRFTTQSGATWYFGEDHSDSNKLKISPDGVGTTDAFVIDRNRNVYIGANSSALATNATDGFLFIPTSAGAPTGVPAGYNAGATVALCYDKTNHKLYAYDGAWKSTAALA